MNADIQMIGMDFDLTLVSYPNGKPYVPSETKQLLEDLIRSGVEVGIVSGRNWEDMKYFLADAGIAWGDPFPSFIVTREAFLYWLRDGTMIPDEEWNQKHNFDMNRLTRTIFQDKANWFEVLEAAGFNMVKWILWSDYGLEIQFQSTAEAERARLFMNDWTRDMTMVTVNRNGTQILITLATAGKGNALLRAASEKNLLPQQVLAIGDNLNDLTMLDGCLHFNSGAVSNADELVKETVRGVNGIIATQPAGLGIFEILSAYMQEGLLCSAKEKAAGMESA